MSTWVSSIAITRGWVPEFPSRITLAFVFAAQTVPRLLHALCSDELTVWEHLETQQALFKQFAEILDFIMQFDNLKVSLF